MLAVDSDLEHVESESGHFYPTECRLATVSSCNHWPTEELTHSPHLSKRMETSQEFLTPSAVLRVNISEKTFGWAGGGGFAEVEPGQ
jgi:hypothetical protein